MLSNGNLTEASELAAAYKVFYRAVSVNSLRPRVARSGKGVISKGDFTF